MYNCTYQFYGPLWTFTYFFVSISVYCACSLGNHNIENRLTDKQITPHFYVNVADIESLESEMAYIACKFVLVFVS